MLENKVLIKIIVLIMVISLLQFIPVFAVEMINYNSSVNQLDNCADLSFVRKIDLKLRGEKRWLGEVVDFIKVN